MSGLPGSCCTASVLLALLLLSAAADEATWVVPAAHSGALVLAMRADASALWPAAYDPTRFREEGSNLRLAFTRPPDLAAGGSIRGALRWAVDPLGEFERGALRTRC